MLMRGLGMRDTNRYIKDQKRGRKDIDNFNRPKFFSHDGKNYRVLPSELHGDKHYKIPHAYHDPTTALVMRKYLEDPQRSFAGLSESYVWRQFEYERSQWPLRNFTSPYKNDRGRTKRDEHEFILWHHHHPFRQEIEERMDEELEEGCDRPYDRILHKMQLRGGLPGGNLHVIPRNYQEPYRQRRSGAIYNRPGHRQRGSVDYRDPIFRPPYPSDDTNPVQRTTQRAAHGPHEGRSNRHPQLFSTGRRSHGPRGAAHSRYPVMEIPGNSAGGGRFGQPPRDPYVSRFTRGNPMIFNDPTFLDDALPTFLPRRGDPHRHHDHHLHDEDEDEDDFTSQHSTGSYVRHPSPQIIYPAPAPYHGRALRHSHRRRHGHHEDYADDDDDDDDEHFLGRRGHMGGRRGLFSLGRDGGRGIRVGLGGHGREDLEYGYSGDEDDLLGL